MCDTCGWEYYADALRNAIEEHPGSRRAIQSLRGRILTHEHVTDGDIEFAERFVAPRSRRSRRADPLEAPTVIPSARFSNLDFSEAPAPPAPRAEQSPVGHCHAPTPQAIPTVAAQAAIVGYVLAQPSYWDCDNNPAYVAAQMGAATKLAAPYRLGVTLRDRAYDRMLMQTARGRDKNERYAYIRNRLVSEYSMLLLIETMEQQALGRGAFDIACQFIAFQKPVAVICGARVHSGGGAFHPVKQVVLSNVDDWKQNYGKVIL